MNPTNGGNDNQGVERENPSPVPITVNVGLEAQIQLVNQLTPIFDHLENMTQNVNILVTSLTNNLSQNVLTMVLSGNHSMIRPNGKENINGFNQP